MINMKNKRLTPFQIIIYGFLLIIFIGTVLLMLPISSKARVVTPFFDALFTATSATCVTGLVVRDTATYWSSFGHIVILTLIQIGGMGVVSVAFLMVLASRRKIGLSDINTIKEAVGAPDMGSALSFAKFIIKGMIIVEVVGGLLLSPFFINQSDRIILGMWHGFFHSISAFCNAGFDLMGYKGEFSSLTTYVGNTFLNVIVMLLIVVGGVGFITWDDFRKYKFKVKKYRVQSKVSLVVMVVLLVLPTLFFYIFEFSKWNELSGSEKVLAAMFQSVTARTAGFNTVDLDAMSAPSKALMIFLMLIGGSSGSTAGGMKTTTLAVVIGSMFAAFTDRDDVVFFRRKLPHKTIKNASALFALYVFIFLTSGVIISVIDGIGLDYCLFETASAIATVGVTLGITSMLSLPSRLIIVFLMFVGRVGGLTLLYAAGTTKHNNSMITLTEENIMVG